MKAANGTFEEKSFHEIGMRDIAVKAGVSAASIYRYFPSRDDSFVEALIQDTSTLLKKLLQQRVKKCTLETTLWWWTTW
ncbi:MAG: helix-turn-helix domain-containing protein [Desulfobacterales bacterium]